MIDAATSLYAACTDFILAVSHVAGISYRDANALLFFIVWPALTLGLLVAVATQGLQLTLARRRREKSRC